VSDRLEVLTVKGREGKGDGGRARERRNIGMRKQENTVNLRIVSGRESWAQLLISGAAGLFSNSVSIRLFRGFVLS
jgi:hypothetical protein